MSRIIKYRAYIKAANAIGEVTELNITFGSALVLWSAQDGGRHCRYQLSEIELLQYVGLKDKNGSGAEVYEGDIIGRTTLPDKVIVWHNSGFHFYRLSQPKNLVPLKILDAFDCVIGNIYSNPELIK